MTKPIIEVTRSEALTLINSLNKLKSLGSLSKRLAWRISLTLTGNQPLINGFRDSDSPDTKFGEYLEELRKIRQEDENIRQDILKQKLSKIKVEKAIKQNREETAEKHKLLQERYKGCLTEHEEFMQVKVEFTRYGLPLLSFPDPINADLLHRLSPLIDDEEEKK